MQIQKLDTKAPKTIDKKDIEKETKELKTEMAELQHKMRAQEKYSLLIILQGMDASGKDGVVRRVFSEIPAFGISVASLSSPQEKNWLTIFYGVYTGTHQAKGKLLFLTALIMRMF